MSLRCPDQGQGLDDTLRQWKIRKLANQMM